MKVRFYFEHWLPSLVGALAITLYPFVLVATTEAVAVDTFIVQHEMVHVEQVRRLGFFAMYWRYVVEYFKYRFQGMDHASAYAHLSLEVEAFARQKDPAMLEAYRAERA